VHNGKQSQSIISNDKQRWTIWSKVDDDEWYKFLTLRLEQESIPWTSHVFCYDNNINEEHCHAMIIKSFNIDEKRCTISRNEEQWWTKIGNDVN
jgi:hypothetical protein